LITFFFLAFYSRRLRRLDIGMGGMYKTLLGWPSKMGLVLRQESNLIIKD
jgi:hypothetical protein